MARKRADATPDLPVGPMKDLTAAELRFVDEYLIDRDPGAAAVRAGVARINAKRSVQKWLGDPRIVQAIQLKTDGADLDKMISPQRIMAGFIEVAFDRNAPSAARNTALRELAAIKKMYGEEDKDKKGSGVILVPVMGSVDDFARAAMASQEKLKEDVRS